MNDFSIFLRQTQGSALSYFYAWLYGGRAQIQAMPLSQRIAIQSTLLADYSYYGIKNPNGKRKRFLMSWKLRIMLFT